MRPILAAAILMLALAVWAPAPTHAQSREMLVTNLRRPPTEFLEHGDVIGVSPTLLQRLGIEEEDFIEIETPLGKRFAFQTKVHGTRDSDLFAKKTIRDRIGLEDGQVLLKVRPITWGSGPTEKKTLQFTDVQRPPRAFLDYGDAVGISLAAMRELGGYPGMAGRIVGPNGSSMDVSVEILDRGDNSIAMKQTLRTAIGVSDGAAQVTLEIVPGAAGASRTPLYWFRTLQSAIGRAREEGRPLLILASDRTPASQQLAALFDDPVIHRALLRTRKYRFELGSDENTQSFFKIGEAPTLVLLTPEGQEIGRLTGVPEKARLLAALRQATAQVRPPQATSED